MSDSSVDAERLVPPSVKSVAEGDGRYRIVVSGDVDESFGGDIVELGSDLSSRFLVASLTLDLSAVSVFGASGLRVAFALDALASRNGFEFDAVGASNTTRKVLSIGGVDGLLHDGSGSSSDDGGSIDGFIASDQFTEVVAQGVLNGRDAVVITTPEIEFPGPTIVFVNRAFTDLFGYSADEVIGETPRMLQGPLTDRSVLDRMKEHHRRGEVFEDDLINYASDGRPFVMSWKVIPGPAHAGPNAYCMSMQREITDERRRKRFDLANDLLDTQLRIGAISLHDPSVPIKHTMTTLLSVQTMMLGAGVATIVLVDREGREHRFSTALSETDVRTVDVVLGSYGPEPIAEADLVTDSATAHMRIDSPTMPTSSYRSARLVLSGVHSDWLHLADVEYHERLLQRVFSHNP